MKKIFSSFSRKMFAALSLIVLLIVCVLIFLNTFVFGKFYTSYQQDSLVEAYSLVNELLSDDISDEVIDEIEKITEKGNLDILIEDAEGTKIYSSNNSIEKINEQLFNHPSQQNMDIGLTPNHSMRGPQENKVIFQNDSYEMIEINNKVSDRNYIVLRGDASNGYQIYIHVAINSIDENVSIVTRFTFITVFSLLVMTVVVIGFMTKRITAPILEINEIAERMSELDFSKRYKEKETGDEINNLGKSINKMSDELENTISKLKVSNIQLEMDIEEKSRIDETRKRFISDVSHELKTPIALIQAYAEGLQEEETTEENRKYYREVIVDEACKMDKLVKQLLELMKIEYGNRKFNDREFDVISLERKIVKKASVMLDEKNIELIFEDYSKIDVLADDFYIEQVFTNYLTNAIKYSTPINGNTQIHIKNEVSEDGKTVRVMVQNTGENLSKEALEQVWERFFKLDESRNRDKGGIGIGLSLVKAIMTNYNSDFGVKNLENGVEFYFELNLI